ncbi:MAG: DUF2851 family protein [Bacteroidales bacterium]|jgi:hypothetical protein|nr:DUF2851 family protein [Bacteroidales bacterium]
MTEDFLHYIWQHRLYLREEACTAEGEPVEVERPGMRHANAGPDFTDARVRIGETLWAGCVEIHLCSSDWEKHGHHNDPAYNNVILHVVYRHDADVYNARRTKVPVMELHFDSRYYENYLQLAENREPIACRDKIGAIDDFSRLTWLDRLAVERLEQKSEAILQTYASTGNNWEETLYRRLARNFGFSLNALPFETLAKSLPYNILLKHRDHPEQIESLLFGQAGMLEDEHPEDAYYSALRREYFLLQKKYRLVPVERFLWKFLRLRPVNFPTVRIAQFAGLICRNEHLFSRIIADPEHTEPIFAIEASPYWDNHYVFGKEAAGRKKIFGKTAYHAVMINTVIPFLFVYGKTRGREDDSARAVGLLEKLPPEKNNILSQWEKLGIRNTSAFVSQSLLQLKNEYCSVRRCLHCAFGNAIVRKTAENGSIDR